MLVCMKYWIDCQKIFVTFFFSCQGYFVHLENLVTLLFRSKSRKSLGKSYLEHNRGKFIKSEFTSKRKFEEKFFSAIDFCNLTKIFELDMRFIWGKAVKWKCACFSELLFNTTSYEIIMHKRFKLHK